MKKVTDQHLGENPIRNDSLICSTLFQKTIAILLVIFVFEIGNIFGQTFTTIGTSNGSNTSVSYPCPLADYYENHRTQFLIRASELTAAGIPSGAIISSIRFNVTATNSTGVIERLSIYVGGTTTTSLGTVFLTAPTQRYGPTDYTPIIGSNTFTFSSNYSWNGTENILVQICNGSITATSGITYTNNTSVSWQTGLSFNASYSNRIDDNNSLCATSTVTGTQTSRPMITFGLNTPPPNSPINANASSTTLCSSQSTTINVTGSIGTTYWFAGSCGNSIANSIGSGASLVVSPTATTTYFARNYSNGQWSLNCASITISVNSISTPSNPTSNSPQCNSVTITRTGTPSAGITWYWQGTNANGISTTLGSGSTYTASSSGTYYIRAQNSFGCWSSSSGSIPVTITNSPSAPGNPTSNSPQCTSVTLTRSGTPPSGITWYWQGTNSIGTSTNLGSGSTYIATMSGTHYLRAQNSSGCWSSTSGSVLVSITNTPLTPNNPTCNSPQCTSSTITRSGNPPAGTTWYWQATNANGTSTTLGSGPTYIGSSSGTYYIRALNSSGCWSSSSGSVSIVISGFPSTPSVNITSPTCVVQGSAIITNYNSSQTYSFSPSGPIVGTNGIISGMTPSTLYSVSTFNSSNCQSSGGGLFSIAPTLLVPNTPTINLVGSSCVSTGTASISNYDNSQTYNFTPSGPTVNSTGSIIGATMGVAYTLTSSNTNCTSSPSSVFTLQNQLLVPNTPGLLSSSANQNICDSILITRNSNPPIGVLWYWQGTNPSGTSSSFGSSNTYYAHATGTYYLRALSSNGCWSDLSSSIQVFGGRPPNPTNPFTDAPQCDTMIVSFNGSPGNEVTWYWQGTSPYSALTIFGSSNSIFVTTSGTYYLRALSSLGCWSLGTGSIQVNVGRPVAPNSLTSNSPNCNQVLIQRTGIVPSLTGWYWQGTNPNGTSTLYSGSSFAAITSGTYYLRARNLNNCWSNESTGINVIVYDSSTEQQQITSCGSYIWIDGITYTSDTVVSYTYPQTTNNGCDSTIQLTLNINPIHSVISNVLACENHTWIDGVTYFSDTLLPAFPLISMSGCDSLVTLNLMIGQPMIDTIIIDTTANQSFVYNGITYSESGTYYLTLLDQFGCDSIVQLNLIIENSDLVELDNVNISIYPNPSIDGKFIIESNQLFKPIKLIDFSGRIVPFNVKNNVLDLSQLNNGIYILTIEINRQLLQFKIIH